MENRFENIEKFLSIEQFYKLTYKFCGNDDLARFVNIQVGQANKKPKGPKLYRQVLLKKYCLPTPRTLLKLIKEVKVSSGLDNPQLFEILRRKVNCFDENSKYCIICIDEMSIKDHLFYNRGTDCVIGLSEGGDGDCVLLLSQNSSVSTVSHHSECSNTSNFSDELHLEPKPKRLKLMSTEVVAALDRGVPKLERGTGLNQATVIKDTINEWNVSDRIKAMCFDTCAANTGVDEGTCVRLEKMLKRPLLYLACRHHMYELILRSVVEVVWPGVNSPNVAIFVRFQNFWKTIDQTKYETGTQDALIMNQVHGKKMK
ncbi:hypothetical protein JTB14_011659 [Gonioctena quinquepunctata]|nr:hypothetical protein JTB14_011659 [Gonioctena quinquepunctata]